MKKIEKSAKSLDEALKLAASALGVSVGEVGYEVTHEVGKGLIGFLIGREVTIEAWLKKDEEAEKEALEKAQKLKATQNAKTQKSEKQPKNVNSKDAAKTEFKKEVTKNQPVSKPTVQRDTPAKATLEKRDLASKPEPKPRTAGESKYAPISEKNIEDAKYFLSELLTKMGIVANIETNVGDDVLNINVSGDKMGLLIGKRGDTLDAVQYLTSLYVNRDKAGYIKINIDTENYRSKREETLIRLAHGLERRVMRERKTVTLEPMSPYERRIIHAALQGNSRIKTYSVGNEPNRKIVVAPVR